VLQSVEPPNFMKIVWSALRTSHLYPSVNVPGTFRLVVQCHRYEVLPFVFKTFVTVLAYRPSISVYRQNVQLNCCVVLHGFLKCYRASRLMCGSFPAVKGCRILSMMRSVVESMWRNEYCMSVMGKRFWEGAK
jgi:hypothetical protein